MGMKETHSRLNWLELCHVHSRNPPSALQEAREKAVRARWNVIKPSQILFWLEQKGVHGVATRYRISDDTVRRKIRCLGVEWKEPAEPKPVKPKPVKRTTGLKSGPKRKDGRWRRLTPDGLKEEILAFGVNGVAKRKGVSPQRICAVARSMGFSVSTLGLSDKELISESIRR